MGAKCHFAHGKEELRGMSENQPTIHQTQMTMNKPVWGGDFSNQQTQLTVPNQSGGGNYKTARCKFFEKGHCKFGQNCSFAHGDQDLRSTNSFNSPQGSGMGHTTMGSAHGGSNIHNQVAQQQIQQLGQSLEAYHVNSPIHLDQIRKAQEMVQSGNVQGAASILHSIMSRPDRTKEDKENYAIFTYKMQTFGENLYQQLQSQQFTQPMGSPQLGNHDMNQMGGFSSGFNTNTTTSYNKQNFGQSYHKDTNEGYHGKEMNQGHFGGNMTGNFGMQNTGGYGGHYANQGGFGGVQKENSYSRF